MIDNICYELFDSIRDWYAKEEFDPDGKLIYLPPPLADVWLDGHVHQEQKEKLGKHQTANRNKF